MQTTSLPKGPKDLIAKNWSGRFLFESFLRKKRDEERKTRTRVNWIAWPSFAETSLPSKYNQETVQSGVWTREGIKRLPIDKKSFDFNLPCFQFFAFLILKFSKMSRKRMRASNSYNYFSSQFEWDESAVNESTFSSEEDEDSAATPGEIYLNS